MASSTRRPFTRPVTSGSAAAGLSPVVQALLMSGAVGFGIWLLVTHGRLTWPPGPLLTSFYTLAGCLGLVGPIVLTRRGGRSDAALGELVWLAGGLLIWVHDLGAALRGDFRLSAWPTPLGPQAMGLGVLAVMLAGWSLFGTGRSWSWTNVVGWILGVFWVGMAFATFFPVGIMTPTR